MSNSQLEIFKSSAGHYHFGKYNSLQIIESKENEKDLRLIFLFSEKLK